jgi:hypothetical protein
MDAKGFELLMAAKILGVGGGGIAMDAEGFERLMAAKILGKGGAGKIKELEGVPPLTFTANGQPLLDYRIYGNTVQTGTPTSENPIMPIGCGERTVNLFDKNTITPNTFFRDNGEFGSSPYFSTSDFIPVENGDYLIYKARSGYTGPYNCIYDENKNFVRSIISSVSKQSIITIGDNEKYIRISINSSDDVLNRLNECMVVKDDTAPTSYIPYGYKLPMVSRSENLFDGSYLSYGIIASTGEIMGISGRFAFYIPVEPNTAYTISRIKGTSTYFYYGFTDAVPTAGVICAQFGDLKVDTTTNTLANKNHKYLMFFFGAGKSENVMLTEGSTAPTSYVPYYHNEENIYIGSDPLAEDEYVDFGEQKIYRMVNGTLTPTDPPVPIPALPTIDGETIIDYNPSETPAVEPEKMYVKYKP